VVNSFTLNKYAGKNTELIFNFSITANRGRIFSGPYLEREAKHLCYSLQTVKWWCVNCGNVSTMLNFRQDFLTKEGQDILYISCSVRSNRRWK
jgi:hypothetical protein